MIVCPAACPSFNRERAVARRSLASRAAGLRRLAASPLRRCAAARVDPRDPGGGRRAARRARRRPDRLAGRAWRPGRDRRRRRRLCGRARWSDRDVLCPDEHAQPCRASRDRAHRACCPQPDRSGQPAGAFRRPGVFRRNSAGGRDGARMQLVSRSDSTLRGHLMAEVRALQAVREQIAGAGFDGVLLVPAFIEAGRVTAADIHWARTGSGLCPGRSDRVRS